MNLLTCFNIDRYIYIVMHSVKSETKCMTTIDTVNSRLAHTPATAAKFPFYSVQTLTLFARTLTRGPDGNCTMLRQLLDWDWSFFEK